jgi:putative ABC transport system substrate-binding protein
MLVTISTLTALVALLLFGTPLAVKAQPAGKIARIGILSPGAAEPSANLEPFRHTLRDVGWIEGRNIVFEYRWADGKLDRLPELAAELVRLKVDVLVSSGTNAALAAKNATREIPIVFTSADDPVGSALVVNAARPGGNVTGFSSMATELSAKRLELLREALPGLSRVAVLWNSANPAMARSSGDVRAAAARLGITFQSLEVRGNPGEFEGAFSSISRARPDGLLIVVDVFTTMHRARIAEFATRHRLPMMAPSRIYVDAGALMSYSTNYSDLFRQSAEYVDRILKGAKPTDLPVQQPTKFELVINMRTAKALGLTVPPSLLLRADQVIE